MTAQAVKEPLLCSSMAEVLFTNNGIHCNKKPAVRIISFW